MSLKILLYIVSALEVFLPFLLLLIVYRMHKFRLSAPISGVASYYLVTQVFMTLVNMLLIGLGLNDAFWEAHPFGSNLMNVFLNALFQGPVIYLVLIVVLKKRIAIYDAMAVGIGYWLADALMLGVSGFSYARIASLNAEGRLSEMVSEELTLAQLTSYAEKLQTDGIVPFLLQLLGLFALTALAVSLSLLLYHAVKRPNRNFLFMSMGIHFACLLMTNLSLGVSKWLYLGANLTVTGIAAFLFYRYWSWYQAQRRALAEKKKEYKESLKERHD